MYQAKRTSVISPVRTSDELLVGIGSPNIHCHSRLHKSIFSRMGYIMVFVSLGIPEKSKISSFPYKHTIGIPQHNDTKINGSHPSCLRVISFLFQFTRNLISKFYNGLSN